MLESFISEGPDAADLVRIETFTFALIWSRTSGATARVAGDMLKALCEEEGGLPY
jgi:hypothetical protein